MTLPHPEEWGGGGQPYEVYLQVLEELAARWAAVAVAVSVHVLSCHPLIAFGTDEQKSTWLPAMLSGRTIGAYSLSEPQAGSDAAALTCRATSVDGGYRINGAKAWITHGGVADFYSLFARTGEGSQGISSFLIDKDTDGLTFGLPEEKMGLHAIPTTTAHYDDAVVPTERRIGTEGQGLQIAFSALDSGRLGIAAVAVGLAQAALDEAVEYAQQRTTFGRKIIDHQGLGFLLADMAAAVDSSRGHLSGRGTSPRRRTPLLASGVGGQARRNRRGDEGDHRRGPGLRRGGLHPRLSCRAVHAGSEDHPDLRGHQSDPTPGDQSVARPMTWTRHEGVVA